MGGLQRLCEWLLRKRYPAIPVGVGLLLALPSLWVGLQADDLHLRSVVLGQQQVEGIPPHPWAPYSWLDGDPEHNHRWMDAGWMPWWTDQHCRTSFLRPLTALTLMLDHHLWPEHPMLMHAQSMAWYGLVIGVAAILYRRITGKSGPVWVVGLAALLFAVDDAHAIPVGWVANRNALVAGFFGFLTLLVYDRWRRDGWRPGAWIAPLALAAAVLGKEEAVSTGAYLLAYAVFLDRGSWRSRLAALLPCILVGLVWFTFHRWSGYSALYSEVYADPSADPGRFLLRVIRNAPLLLTAQVGLPPSDLSNSCSTSAFAAYWATGVVVLVSLGLLVCPLLLRSRTARFWFLGMVLSTVPISAIFPSDRLLMFVGLGAMGLLAEWIGGLHARARPVRLVGGALLAVHLIIAPLTFPVMANSMKYIGGIFDRAYATLPNDPGFASQTAVFVNSAACIADSLMFKSRRRAGQPVPIRSLTLAPSCSRATLTRTGQATLVVRPHGGYLRPRGWSPPDDESAPLFSSRYHLQHLDRLVRSEARPMRLGQRVELATASIEITALTQDGRPAEATFRFRVPLEDRSLRWFVLRRGRFFSFIVPAIGQHVEVPSPLD